MFGFDAKSGTNVFQIKSEKTLLMHLNHQAAFLHMVGNVFLSVENAFVKSVHFEAVEPTQHCRI